MGVSPKKGRQYRSRETTTIYSVIRCPVCGVDPKYGGDYRLLLNKPVFLQQPRCLSATGTRRTPKLPNSEAETCYGKFYHTVLLPTTVPWLRGCSQGTSVLKNNDIHKKVTVDLVSYITIIHTFCVLICIGRVNSAPAITYEICLVVVESISTVEPKPPKSLEGSFETKIIRPSNLSSTLAPILGTWPGRSLLLLDCTACTAHNLIPPLSNPSFFPSAPSSSPTTHPPFPPFLSCSLALSSIRSSVPSVLS